MLDRYNHIPLYIQLKDEILNRIRKGFWNVGTKISTEKELMDEFDVGRATVRQALSLLVNEGYLYKKRGIGTFVARKNPTLGFESLISLSYSLKARGLDSKNQIKDKRIITPTKDLLKKLKWNKYKEIYYLKRLRFIEDQPLAIEHSYFSKEAISEIDKLDLTSSLAKIILKDLKFSITKVEQVTIARKPNANEIKELNINKDTLIFDLERWIYIKGEKNPFYYLKFIIPGSLYPYPY
ncbi:MAG: GntR family transcriptional regulator [Firmicutes bacterium]|nr:GntR family transcriptional regulator [Bacillota bacterium]